jgi:solute carrier family 25 (peroxisomal adenine nucleotide transporter), member 17
MMAPVHTAAVPAPTGRLVHLLLHLLVPLQVMVVNPTIQYILYESLVARALELRQAAAHSGPYASRRLRQHQQQPRIPTPMPLGGGLALSALEIFTLSAVAKIGATLLTYPMLVVKNRLQVRV